MKSRNINLFLALFLGWFVLALPISITVIVLSIIWLTKKGIDNKETVALIISLIGGVIEFVMSLVIFIQSLI
ncbi:MAG: hypothetical protein WC343_04415 [Bacilli bacterium]|jgi:hypothetical protein